jgi:hypothetical protein
VQAEVASLPVIEQLLDFMRSSQRGVA